MRDLTLEPKIQKKFVFLNFCPRFKSVLAIPSSHCCKAINADFSSLIEKIEINPKATKFKVKKRVRITKYTTIFSKHCTENWSREKIIIDSL